MKYITRWRNKGGLADIDKAIHFLQLLKQFNPEPQEHKQVSHADAMRGRDGTGMGEDAQ